MTKEEMNQLSNLREEIRELEKDILNLERRTGRIVTDKVKASSREFPYIETSVKITGIEHRGDNKRRRKAHEKRRLLIMRKVNAETMEKRIALYINSVNDSRIRRIMKYKYEEGYTWERIGSIMHCDRTTAEKAVTAYLNTHPEEEIKE